MAIRFEREERAAPNDRFLRAAEQPEAQAQPAADAMVVTGLSALLHPDSEVQCLTLSVTCDAHPYGIVIECVANRWSYAVTCHEACVARDTESSQDTALVSSLLSVLDHVHLQPDR